MPVAGRLETWPLRMVPEGLIDDAQLVSDPAVPNRATGSRVPPFVPHRTALAANLAVFGHREFAFTQRVDFAGLSRA